MDKLFIAIYLALTVSGVTLVKLGSHGAPLLSKTEDKLIWNIGPLVILGLIAYGLSFLLFMWLVSRLQLSFLIPLTAALVQIAVFIVGIVLFKESLTFIKVLAFTLIVVGVVLLQVKTGEIHG